jgi:hypothetical protein
MSFARTLLALTVATALWLPAVHLCHKPPPRPALAHALAEQQLRLWQDPEQRATLLASLRSSNAEWDFMARTYTFLALVNVALAEPARAEALLPVLDDILEATLRAEEDFGMQHFLLPYGRARPFVVQPARSLFLDGELALMLGARRWLRDEPRWARLHRERAATIRQRMESSPTLSVESYPDEAWTFCHAIALASLVLLDALDGTDHRPLLSAWLAHARARLVDEPTGLLVSSYTLAGEVRDGPEGSSLFMVAHCLQLVDPAFAREQYARARAALGRTTLGFGWAREWPEAHGTAVDIDSGPLIPGLEASAGASGMAVLGAAAFGDEDYLDALLRSLELAGFPVDEGGARAYAASNVVGDAVLLYALTQGPLWQQVAARRGEVRS